MNQLTISVERFAELIEKEIRLDIIKRAAIKERFYINNEDLLAMIGVEISNKDEADD